MRIQQDDHGILGTNHQGRTTIDGPSQTKRDQRLASTNHSQTSQGFLRIWKFLPTIHTKILQTGTPIKQPTKERHTIRLDTGMLRIIRYPEEEIHQRTSPHDAGSLPNFPNQVGRIKIRSGAVLTQMDSNGDRHPVAFMSKMFNDTKK